MRAQAECEEELAHFEKQGKRSRGLFEALSLARVARAILCVAVAREESRGAHFRSDFPHRDDGRFQKFLQRWAEYNRANGNINYWLTSAMDSIGIKSNDIPPEVQF